MPPMPKKPILWVPFYYSLRPIILFANIDVSGHVLVIDTSVLAKSNMGRRGIRYLLGVL
jgi:hypothetical protein